MTPAGDTSFGCAAFGHLASAYVDAELAAADQDRFATHLPGCAACQGLCAEYRALDIVARPALPQPSPGEWDRVLAGVLRVVEEDRAEAARSPWQGALRFLDGAFSARPWLRPLLATAAAAALIGLSFGLSRALKTEGVPTGIAVNPNRPRPTAVAVSLPVPARVLGVSCQPGYAPTVFTIGEDDPMTVVQCEVI
jgi:anti-sigma factor RsiW